MRQLALRISASHATAGPQKRTAAFRARVAALPARKSRRPFSRTRAPKVLAHTCKSARLEPLDVDLDEFDPIVQFRKVIIQTARLDRNGLSYIVGRLVRPVISRVWTEVEVKNARSIRGPKEPRVPVAVQLDVPP